LCYISEKKQPASYVHKYHDAEGTVRVIGYVDNHPAAAMFYIVKEGG